MSSTQKYGNSSARKTRMFIATKKGYAFYFSHSDGRALAHPGSFTIIQEGKQEYFIAW
jgi:hypothetical protein